MSEEKQTLESNLTEENELAKELETLKISSEEKETLKKPEKLTISSVEDKKSLVTLISFDEEEFVVEEASAFQSVMIKNAIEDCTHGSIVLANVDGKTLARVINYCNKHAEGGGDLDKFDEEFLDVDQAVLFDLIMAANYLNIKSLLENICKKLANMIKGKTPEQIRETFQIENDFAPDKEAEIRAENPWAFQ